jgi:hypothetical protein
MDIMYIYIIVINISPNCGLLYSIFLAEHSEMTMERKEQGARTVCWQIVLSPSPQNLHKTKLQILSTVLRSSLTDDYR